MDTLQEAVQTKRYEVIRLAGFLPDKPLPEYLQSKLDAYLQTYAEWYRSKYGESGKPSGSTLNMMTDSENETYTEWQQAVKDHWYLENEKREKFQTAVDMLTDLGVNANVKNVQIVIGYISSHSYSDTDIEQLINEED